MMTDGTHEDRIRRIEERLIAENSNDAEASRRFLREEIRQHARMTLLQTVVALCAIVALIIVVVGSVVGQERLDAQQTHTCQIITDKLASDIGYRSAQSKFARKSLRASRAYLRDVRSLVRLVKASQHQTRGLKIFGKFFDDGARLWAISNQSAAAQLVASSRTVKQWRRLAEQLSCHS